MDLRPIGVFDSGVGGLTVLRALRQLLPGEDIIYFGDSARMPYGPRPVEQLRRIAVQNMDYLASFGVKAILSACGTTSSNAREELAAYPIPAFGVIDPALEAMSAIPGDRPLCVIATAATIKVLSAKMDDPRRGGRKTVYLSCPSFVPTIEAGHIRRDDPLVKDCVARELESIRGERFGAVLLGCTHYGFIAGAIRDYLGEDVRLMSTAECSAEALRNYLVQNELTGGERGRARFLVSGDCGAFERLAGPYLEIGPVHAEQAPVMES